MSLMRENYLGNLIQWRKEAERKSDGGDLEGLRARRRVSPPLSWTLAGTGSSLLTSWILLYYLFLFSKHKITNLQFLGAL